MLNDVTFSVTSKRTLGLLGRNGHGKSTTMKIIMGILASDSGEVLLDGKAISSTNFKLGYLPEERGLYQKVTILDQMIYFGKLRGLKAADAKKSATELLERLEMTEYIKKKAITLSKGNQQKIQLAIALLNDPDIIILDEPYSGLDPVNSKLLQELIEENAKKSKLILFSSHQLGTVEEFCEDICIINHGEVLLSGNLRDIKEEYPKDKLLFVPNKDKLKELEALLTRNSVVAKTEEDKRGYVVTLTDERKKNALLEVVANGNIDLQSFAVLEPTLLEIFLEKIGEVSL